MKSQGGVGGEVSGQGVVGILRKNILGGHGLDIKKAGLKRVRIAKKIHSSSLYELFTKTHWVQPISVKLIDNP